MATPSEELISAVNADDAGRVAELVADDPALAGVRDEHGVSAVLLSRYRFARPVTDALLAADPDLDIFDAAALGYADRLRSWLVDDPAWPTGSRPTGSRHSTSRPSSARPNRRGS